MHHRRKGADYYIRTAKCIKNVLSIHSSFTNGIHEDKASNIIYDFLNHQEMTNTFSNKLESVDKKVRYIQNNFRFRVQEKHHRIELMK